MTKGYDLLDMFGSYTVYKAIIILFILVAVVIGFVLPNNIIDKIKITLENDINIKQTGDYILFIESVTKNNSVNYEPYGDIVYFNLETAEKFKINSDSYYDASPTISKTNNCIYFESKRRDDVDLIKMSSKSDLYKYSFRSKKIAIATRDISFAKDHEDSSIESPLISQYNDSIMAFFEIHDGKQILICCNYLKNKVYFKREIGYNRLSKIVDFLHNKLVVFDYDYASLGHVGTYFIDIYSGHPTFLPDTYKKDYYITGGSLDGFNYFLTNRRNRENLQIYSYNIESDSLSRVKIISQEHLKYKGYQLLEQQIINPDYLFLKQSNNKIGIAIFSYNNNSGISLIISNNKEKDDFLFSIH